MARSILNRSTASSPVLLMVILFVVSHPCSSQTSNLKLEHLDTEQGLTQNLVYSIAQDNLGFLWFATDEGLNRFDGYEFKTFRHSPNDTNTLVDNSVHCMLFDQGILWLGTNNGISQYNLATERIHSLPIDYYDETKLNGSSVNALKKDDQGRIWIAYLGSGVDVITPGEKNIFHYTIHRDKTDRYRLPDDYVTSIEFLNQGEKILGTRSGLFFLNADGTVMTEPEMAKKYPWRNNVDGSVRCITLSRNKKIVWLGTEVQGIYRVDLTTGQLQNFSTANKSLLFNNNVPSVFEDSKGNTWIGGEAIYLFDEKKNELIPYNEFGVRNNVTIRNPIMTIFEDRDRNLWFGTFRLGVLKYNPRGASILHYHKGQGDGSLGHNQVLSFNEDSDGNLFVGTDGGGLFKLLKNKSFFELAQLNQKFSSQVIKCIYRHPDGNYWLGTWDGGLMDYEPRYGKLNIFSSEKKNFGSRHVWDIQPDSLNNLWIASLRDGLFYMDLRKKTFKNFKSDPADSSSLVNNDILSILVDSKNTLWVGTSDGLSLLKPGSTKFINRQKKDIIANVLCFYEDPKQRIWMGTNGGGIIIANHDARVLKTLTEKDGLPSSTICSIIPDRENNLWVSTYNGVVKISPTDFSINIIPYEAGLQGKEYIPRSGFRTSDGKILFGGVNGFNIINPDSFKIDPSISKIIFTSLKIQNDEILPDRVYLDRKILNESISQAEKISLDYKDNSFTIAFSPLIYNLQKNIRYSYKLENFDPNWQYTDSEHRYAHYTNIDPGTYALKIRASFDGKTWSNPPQTLTISITPPWWATTPFRITALLFSFFLLYGAYKGRVRLLKAQKRRLETLVQSRTVDLKKSNEEIQNLLNELAHKKNQIEEQNHELLQVNDAVVHQRDALERKSVELELAQARLKETNTNLEQLIAERTQKLSDTLRELETFLYRASHDLRGPITSMLGVINVAAIDKSINSNEDYFGLLNKSVHQLDRTLDMLLLKHSIDEKQISPERFDRESVLNLVKNMLENVSCYRSSDFKVTVPDPINITVDRLMLKTILSELLKNAFFFSQKSENKEVKLEMRHVDDQLVIEVSDHGPGVKSEVKDKIFHMFYRGHETSVGNGLGLYMVKSALQKVNGRIEVETEEGRFAIFRVYLPVDLAT